MSPEYNPDVLMPDASDAGTASDDSTLNNLDQQQPRINNAADDYNSIGFNLRSALDQCSFTSNASDS